MKRIGMILVLLLGLLPASCATLTRPQRVAVPAEHRDRLDVHSFLMDIFFTGGVGLILDFIHGTIWLPSPDYTRPGMLESKRSKRLPVR